jgi:DNA uptake protein ComE-like DNA-binding protein
MFRRLNQAVREYFGFSAAEARGFLGLMLVIVVALLLPFAWDLRPARTPDTSAADSRQLDSLLAGLTIEPAETALPNRYARSNRTETREPEDEATPTVRLFPFNPNTITTEQWQQLGLPRWLAERIGKYRAKGGKFRKKEDLKRIYDFPEETYDRLEPYIRLDEAGRAGGAPPGGAPLNNLPVASATSNAPAEPTKPPTPEPKPVPKTTFTFDLNTADTTELKRVYGIGSKLSARIVKTRTDLGGFHSLGQVRDVWGLDSVVVDELLKHATLRNPQLRKLNVNSAPFDQLRHPYLKFHMARAIVAYRQQHGPFSSPEDLLRVKVIDAKTVEKLTPYLEF